MAFRSAGTAVSTTTSTQTSVTPGTPAGLSVDDIIIIVVSYDATGATFSASGFTVLDSQGIASPDGQEAAVLWKRAVGGDSLTVTRSGGSAASFVTQAFAFNGRDTANPPVISTVATNTSSNASPTTVTANSLTALSGDDLMWFGTLDSNQGTAGNPTFTAPSGYTPQAAVTDTNDHFDVYGVATLDSAPAGATGNVSGTLTHSGSAGWIAYLIRIPSAAGTSYDKSLSIALSTLLSTDFTWTPNAGFEGTAFENTAFFVPITGNTYPEDLALSITGAISDNYQLGINPTTTLTISTVDSVSGQLSAVASVPLSAVLSAAITGNFVALVASTLSLSAAYAVNRTLGINTASAIATNTALAIAAGFTFAGDMLLATTGVINPAAQLAINKSSSFAITMNDIVAAILSANSSTSFAASLLETSSVVLNALASSQFAATLAEVNAGTLNINAVDQIAATLSQSVLGGFTFASSTNPISSTMAVLTASAFSFFGTAALSATTGYSVSDTLNAAGLLTLGITTGYSLAKTLNAVGNASFPITTNDVVSAAGSTYGVNIPLAIHPAVTAISTAIMNAMLNAGISTHVATDAANLIVEAIALGIVTAYSDDAVKNALQIAALVAESIRVVQQLTAANIQVDQQLVAEITKVVEQLTAESVKATQQITAENIKTEI